jgi:hypothetical protein
MFGRSFFMGLALTIFDWHGEARAQREVDAATYFIEALRADRTGEAQKTRPVDARPARAGEIIVTVIRGDGIETRSKPAAAGDWVVRNRCPVTGNEEYLIAADRFPSRYGPERSAPDAQGWREFHPLGKRMEFAIVAATDGEFTFLAPWGERMIARPGDAIVRDPDNHKDIYRIYSLSFECTYAVVRSPRGK